MPPIQTSFEHVSSVLERRAPTGAVITYNDLAEELGLPAVNNLFRNHPLEKFFEQLDACDAVEQRPFLSALVVQKTTGLPGKGFFKSLQILRKVTIAESEEGAVWRRELDDLVTYYSQSSTLLTITLTPAQARRLESLASEYGRPPGELMERTLTDHLAHLESERRQLRRSSDETRKGRTHTHEEVVSKIAAMFE